MSERFLQYIIQIILIRLWAKPYSIYFYFYLKCLLGLIRQFYRITEFFYGMTLHTRYLRFHKILHYLRHDTAGALKYFTVLSLDINKKEIDYIVVQLMTM